MQIILMETIAKLGRLGDVVNVKSGYARNYLVPQGKAQRATEQTIAEFETRRAELEQKQADVQAAAKAIADRLEGLMLQITQKTSNDGKLFGSVTNANIAEALNEQGFVIDKSMIRMPHGQLKQVGDYSIKVVLHGDISAQVTVSVLGETAI
ncbi:large subunit ribosomal protein L9 [Nitrosomonas sp. Nm51]|uniref:50S ribosomal protein L9 n=1 Tax=Nitrosomonas sp. Nm51 TaxID=133720 RepID=UPI0008B9D1E1|nr:50S ribosomal protein L9 [Nitrosomonas sp. Nm51]SER40201.1 large subunit ribosomal protein L9 [Nitrosomonas sp. Nm51]